MTRTGKIARLPEPIREQLNQRILNNEPGTVLIAWLNNLPGAKAVLSERFGGRPIILQNLTQWKNGGYRDWQLEKKVFDRAFQVVVGHLEAKMGLKLNETTNNNLNLPRFQ